MATVSKIKQEDVLRYDALGRRVTKHKDAMTKRNWGLFQIIGMQGRLAGLAHQFGFNDWRLQNELKLLKEQIEKSVTPRTTGHRSKPFDRETAWQKQRKTTESLPSNPKTLPEKSQS
jgi:hypothetical protein